MEKAAIFFSDFHLGAGNDLEDFYSESKFEGVMQQISNNYSAGDSVDIVLLGDTIDIWQVLQGESLCADMNQINLGLSAGQESDRVKDAIDHHSDVFDALGKFLNQGDKRELWIVPGNHDHSLVSNEVQKNVTNHLHSKKFPVGKLTFANYYENTDLKVYAEHGGQFDHNNRYANFSQFTGNPSDECPGYGFVRLFYNWLEGKDPDIDKGPAAWYRVFEYLSANHRYRLLAGALRRWLEYTNYNSVNIDKISLVKKAARYILSTGQTKDMAIIFPDALFERKFNQNNYFSNDNKIEQMFRQLYHNDDPELDDFRTVVEAIIKQKPALTEFQAPDKPSGDSVPSADDYKNSKIESVWSTDGGPAAGLISGGLDKGTAEKMYTHGNYILKGGKLQTDETLFVVLGHTHDADEGDIPGVNGGRFMNTGSWTGRTGDKLHYAEVRKADAGDPRAKLVKVD